MEITIILVTVCVIIPVVVIYSCFVSVYRFLLSWRRLQNLSGRRVVISGCDTGFGFDLALILIKEGMTVYAGCLSEDGRSRLGTAFQSLDRDDGGQSSTYRSLTAFPLDVTSDQSVQDAKETVQKQIPEGEGLWALVNNAGVQGAIHVCDDWLSLEDYKQVMEVNFFGTVRMTHAFMDLMNPDLGGRIVNMCSIMGHLPGPYSGPYCASKAASVAYSSTLRAELFGTNISVIIISPGFHRTGFIDIETQVKSFEERFDSLPAQKRERYGIDFQNKRKHFIQMFSSVLSKGNKNSNVLDAYVHALTASYPYYNYWVGRDAYWAYRIMTHASEITQMYYSAVIRKIFGDQL